MTTDSDNLDPLGRNRPFGPEERKRWSNGVRIIAAAIGFAAALLYNREAVFVLCAIGVYFLVAVFFALAERWSFPQSFRLTAFLVLDAGIITVACYAFGTQYSKVAMFYSVFLIGYLLEKGHKWGFVALLLALISFLGVLLAERHGIIPVAPYVNDRAYVLASPDRLVPNFAIVTACLTIAYILMTFTLVRIKQHMHNERQLMISKWAAQKQTTKLRERLDETLRLEGIGRLAGGVAHDFNNLLTCILGYTRGIYQDLEPGSPIRPDLGEVIHAAEGAAHLTKQLLAFGRKQTITPRELDLGALLINLERILSRIIGEDIDFQVSVKEQGGLVEADPAQMEQVIVNLVANARDAMPSGGRLTATVDNSSLRSPECQEKYGLPEGNYVRLLVKDTGHGMAPETISRVFEPFFTTKEQGKGTGLGLATVYGIVKQNNGAIHVDSTPGKGTTFCVHLKRIQNNGYSQNSAATDLRHPETPLLTSAARSQGESQNDRSETVLVVEDEDIVRRVTTRILTSQGYKIIEASSGEQALDISSRLKQKVDLLLTDVIMPGISGKSLADTLKKQTPSIRILYMSGYSGNVIAHHGVLSPEIELIEKPFTAETLLAKVREVLDREE